MKPLASMIVLIGAFFLDALLIKVFWNALPLPVTLTYGQSLLGLLLVVMILKGVRTFVASLASAAQD